MKTLTIFFLNDKGWVTVSIVIAQVYGSSFQTITFPAAFLPLPSDAFNIVTTSLPDPAVVFTAFGKGSCKGNAISDPRARLAVLKTVDLSNLEAGSIVVVVRYLHLRGLVSL